jgi:hypothetical protein
VRSRGGKRKLSFQFWLALITKKLTKKPIHEAILASNVRRKG